jgi:hypothetical protein
MRTLPLLAGLMMIVALASLAPTTAGMAKACTSATSPSCPGALCIDDNGDGRWTSDECTYHTDPCHFQSDCCSYTGGFWCPEYEDS